jgi:O-methyltransferase
LLTQIPPDMTMEFIDFYGRCRDYTMTSCERMFALHEATRYVVEAGIEGDYVECGVWRGGSSMMAALTLMDLGETDRSMYLYDTFEGMPAPTADDFSTVSGERAPQIWAAHERGTHNEWCYAPLDDVESNMRATGYPAEQVLLVKGLVEETIPAVLPEKIALLRLDTDWYESTRHELEHLYPLLAVGGVLIIDDYGHWDGARKATDEYFAADGRKILLSRVDYTGRMGVRVR